MESLDKKEPTKKFEEILIESVDDAFSCLGDGTKKTIYHHLNDKFMIAKEDIPYRLDDFSEKLDLIFGAGARHLEIIIMKKLYEKVTFSVEWNGPSWLVPNLTFIQYVKLLRLSFENNGQMGEIEVQVDGGEKPKQRA